MNSNFEDKHKKEIPSKPIITADLYYECPSCGCLVKKDKCEKCGQKIDWTGID